MTNEEALIKALTDEDDNSGAEREYHVHYHIACPYNTVSREGECVDNHDISRENCVRCKEKWLAKEVEE